MSLPLLALETSSAWCGVALLCAGTPERLYTREHHGVQEHSARLLPMVDEVLAEAGLPRTSIGAVAFGQGPGGFTGLRVACGVAQGLAFALDVPVLPVVSHAAVASQLDAVPGSIALVAMDARMEEIYLAAYRQRDDGGLDVLLAPQLMPGQGLDAWLLAQLPAWQARPAQIRLCGDASLAYPDCLSSFVQEPLAPVRPTAAAVARLAYPAWQGGEGLAAELAAPLYVRDKVAFTTAERQTGAGGNPRAAGLATERR